MELSGRTRVTGVMGDPIAQVKSPDGMTRAFAERGRDAVCVPIHVSSDDLDEFVRGISRMRNFDGLIVTVPHKFAAYSYCGSTTDRAAFLGAVNVMRRNPDGTWHGDQCDGEGFVNGIRAAGCKPEGERALLVGAGGAGSAIALALVDAGVAELAVHDGDAARRDGLVDRLGARGAAVTAGSADPTGHTVIVNATPVGMRPDDPIPVDVDKLTADMFVGDVITAPAVTPLVEAAHKLGCRTQVGGGMFAAVAELMVAFLLEAGPLSEEPAR